MANTYVDYTATAGQTDFNFSFPFLEDSHVVVEVEGVNQTLTTNYTIETSPVQKIVLSNPTTALAGGELVRIKRVSDPSTDLVDFVNGSILTETELDRAYRHNRYLAEEAYDGVNAGLGEVEGSTNYNANNKQIKNLADGTLATDAVNKGYVDTQIALTDTNLAGFFKSTHTGNGTDNVFTLSFTPQTTEAEAYIVSIDGLVQVPDTDYTIGATTITFNTIPANSAEICVVATAASSVATVNEAQVTATGSSEPRSLANRSADVINVLDYGAYNDGTHTEATTTAILNAFAAAQANGSGSIIFPAGTYSITESPVLESPDSEDPSQNIGPFSISGYGATIDMDASYTRPASPINSILKSGILIAGVTNITIMGLTFQGTGTSLSTATTTNRYNVADPSHKGCGVRIQGYEEATVKDCTFNGLNLGIVINDDDPRGTLPIPADKSIDSGIYNICNNRFFANWQAMSFTYGGNHNGTIIGNYIEECVTKLIGHYGNSKTTNQLSSANHVITNNVWKNCPAVIIGLNNCVFSSNVLDTVIGGIHVNASSDYPNTNFNYDIVNLTIDSNVFNYTNTWTTTSESNMVPVCAMRATIDDAFTAGQTAYYKNLKFTNNTVRTDSIASTSAGIIQLSTTDAKSTFENLNISNNDITITSDNGVFIYNETVSATVQFNLSTKIKDNTFRRGEGATSAGAGNFEITLANSNPVTGATTSVLQITGNTYFGSTSTNSVFRLQRFAQCILDGNQFYVGRAGAIASAIFDTAGCPIITASANYVIRNTSDNRGTLIGYGIVDSNDQSRMESVRIQTNGNTMNRGYAGIHPINSVGSFTFASGYGLIESKNDNITLSPSINWINAVLNVDTYCVVSPTNRDLTTSFISYTDAQTVVPIGYSVKTRLGASGNATAFRLGSTAWLSEGTLS